MKIPLFREAAKCDDVENVTIELSSVIDVLSQHLLVDENIDTEDASAELKQQLYNRLVNVKPSSNNDTLCNLLTDRAVLLLETHAAALRYIFIRYAVDDKFTGHWKDRDQKRLKYVRSKDVSIDMELFVTFAKDYRLWPEHLDRTYWHHLHHSLTHSSNTQTQVHNFDDSSTHVPIVSILKIRIDPR